MENADHKELLAVTGEQGDVPAIGPLPPARFREILPLLAAYKAEIAEDALLPEQTRTLQAAVTVGDICFYAAETEGQIVAVCSVSRTFSTFDCCYSGVFEDFYIAPRFRKSGLAKRLTRYVQRACQQQGIRSLWVGSADCYLAMYNALGFTTRLGTLLCWTAGGSFSL